MTTFNNISTMILLCLLWASTICAVGVYYHAKGIDLGRKEIMTMAIRHHHAFWRVDKEGNATFTWKYVQRAYNSPAVRFETATNQKKTEEKNDQ